MAYQSLTVELGNGEGSFIGVKIEPHIKYKLVMKTDVCLANIAQDPKTHHLFSDEELEKDDDECLQLITDGLDGPLFHGNGANLQHQVRLSIRAGNEITLYVKGKGTYYICGYKTSVNYGID